MLDCLKDRNQRIRIYKRSGFLFFLLIQIIGWNMVRNEKIITKNNQCVISYEEYFYLRIGQNDHCDEDFCKRCEVIKTDCQQMKNINMQIVSFTSDIILYYIMSYLFLQYFKTFSPNLKLLKICFEMSGIAYLLGAIKFFGVIQTFEQLVQSSGFIVTSQYKIQIYALFVLNILNSCIYILLPRDLCYYFIEDVLLFQIFSEESSIQGNVNQHLSMF